MTKSSAPQSGPPATVRKPGAAEQLAVASTVPAPAVNVQQLADKVYQLLLNDLSLQSRRASGRRK